MLKFKELKKPLKRYLNRILLSIPGLIFSTLAVAQIPASVQDEIQRRIDLGLNPSIALGIYDQQGDHYFVRGFKDPKNGEKATTKSLYRLGNLGNTLTGLLTARLIETDSLQPGTPLGSLVYPPLPLTDRKNNPISILDVVSYQSGISDEEAYRISPLVTWDLLYDDDNLEKLRPYRTGGVFTYSDWAMAALAEGLVEYRKKPYPELLRSEVLAPLTLGFKYLKEGQGLASLAKPGSGPEDHLQTPGIKATSLNWVGSIEGLLHYGKVLLSPPASWEKTAEQVFHTYLTTDTGIHTSMGWFKDEQGNLYHAGHYSGYNTFIAIDPTHQRVITLATNTDAADITDLGLFLLDPEINPLEPFIKKPILPDSLQTYAGVYINEAMGLELELQVEEGQLTSIQAEDTVSLHFMGQHRFFYEGLKAHLNFEKDENDQVVGVTLDKNGNKVMLIKMN